MSKALYESKESHEPHGAKTPVKAALASWIGSALEYYDFFIYGTGAALVFGKIFFPSSDPTIGTLLALATFGVGYVARPVGAFFLGHICDKFGRKRVLVMTLILMGASTFLVGCLPTYGQVGVAAPIMLVILRLCQGFSASGEQAGANSMTLEHAPANRRAFFTSFTLSGTQAGLILATAVFLPISRLPEDQLLSWGWRVPFWLSVVVVAVGYIIRRTLEETPAFKEEQEQKVVAKLPVAILFRDYTADVLRVILCALVSLVSTIFGVYVLSYAVNTIKLDRTTML
jgi:MFS family permease